MGAFKVRVEGTLADAYAAYASLHTDLDFVSFFLRRMETELPRAIQKALDQQAYWAAALVLYRRCFNPGSRRRYARTAEERIPEHLQLVHRSLKDERDQIAHASSRKQGRPARVRLVVAPENAPEARRYAEALDVRFIPMIPDGALELMEFLHSELEALEADCRRRVQELTEEYSEAELEQKARNERAIRLDV